MQRYQSHDKAIGITERCNKMNVPILELGEVWSSPDWCIDSHTNDGDEIYLQTRGSSQWQVGRKNYTVCEGGYYFIPQGQRHRIEKFTGHNIHFFYVVLKPGFLKNLGLSKAESAWPDQSMFSAEGLAMRPSFEGLIREITTETAWQANALRAHLITLCVELIRLQRFSCSKHGKPKVHRAAHRARELIEAKPGIDWTIDSLSSVVCLSEGHLLQVFRESFGMTPRQFLIQQRVLRAQYLLHHSNRSITDIAIELGFSSSQHLATCFKKHTGHTPTYYRKTA